MDFSLNTTFFKLYFIDYDITVVLILSPFPPVLSTPTPSGKPHTMSVGHGNKFSGYSISYTVPYIPLAIL